MTPKPEQWVDSTDPNNEGLEEQTDLNSGRFRWRRVGSGPLYFKTEWQYGPAPYYHPDDPKNFQ